MPLLTSQYPVQDMRCSLRLPITCQGMAMDRAELQRFEALTAIAMAQNLGADTADNTQDALQFRTLQVLLQVPLRFSCREDEHLCDRQNVACQQ